MAIPETNFDPPFNLTRASHVRLTTPDLQASRAFYEEVIGLVVSDADADTVYMRGVEEICHHSLTLRRASDDAACEAVYQAMLTVINNDLEVANSAPRLNAED